MANGTDDQNRRDPGDSTTTGDYSNVVFWAIIAIAVLGVLWWFFASLPSTPAIPNTGGTGPSQLSIEQIGTYRYPPGARFSVMLDENTSPRAALRCSPEGVVQEVDASTNVDAALYTVTFEAVSPGQCQLASGSYSSTIVVE